MDQEAKRYFGDCDLCAEPATNLARDIILLPHNPWDTFYKYAPGAIHRGCDKHPSKERQQVIE